MRAALYARVSKEEQVEGYSLDAQRRAFRKYVEEKGWTVHDEYVEEGRSAHTDNVRKRPVFLQAMDAAFARQYDVLVVHKIDRFSRKLRITLEYFEKLGKAGVGFVSIENQINFSTPTGKFMLVMQGGLAELYSDNLGLEVKKGKTERKAQGFYNGLLPFGVAKGEDGIPIPDPDTILGLELAFERAALGDSDRQIARKLNSAGYHTAGNQGSRLFSKDTVRGMLTNRFYLGELPNGDDGWLDGKHASLISNDLFQAAMESRARNRNNPAKTTRADARVSSLSGVARCHECGATLRTMRNRGVARMVCNTRLKRGECGQVSARLDIYEDQLHRYIESFHVPGDYQERILESQRRLNDASDDSESKKQRLQAVLERLKELYKWGDIPRDEYLSESREIEAEMKEFERPDTDQSVMEKLAQFLRAVPQAWKVATEEQRNKLARSLFDGVWIDKQKVLGVTPRPELKPFFDLQYAGLSNDVLQWRPRPASKSLPRLISLSWYP
jgi:DNA invertase Pin-like site-specific DNA recombinase